MKKFANTLLILGFCLMLLPETQGQEDREYNFLIAGVPQYILTNGIRIDFDIHQKESPHWIVLSPYYYIDRSSVDILNLGGSDEYYDPYNYDQIVGVGLGLSRKTFLVKKPVSQGIYLQYGGSYKYFNIDGNNYVWVQYTGDDGLPYQQMEDIKYSLNIHSIGASTTLGYQIQVLPSFYIDVFLGFGVKYSFHDSPENVTIKYNRGIFDYGYTGTHFVGGIRFAMGI